MFGVFDVASMRFAILISVSVFSEGRFCCECTPRFLCLFILWFGFFPSESLVFLVAFVFASLQWL